MNISLNFLPWRLWQHKKRSRRLLIKIGILIFISIIILFFSYQYSNQLNTQISLKEKQLNSLTQELDLLNENIKNLKQEQKWRRQSVIIHQEKVNKILSLLSKLPFEQGELEKIQLAENTLNLMGIVYNQFEFEQLNQMIAESKLFDDIKINQFLLQQDNSIKFEFNLTINNEG